MTVFPGDVVRAACLFNYLLDGDDQVNVFHWEHAGASSLSDAVVRDGLAIALDNMYLNVVALQPAAYKYIDITLQNVTQDVLLGSVAWPTIVDGGSADPLTSPQVTSLVVGRTLRPQTQARKYLGGVSEVQVANGVLLAPWITAAVNFAAAYIGTPIINGEQFDPIAFNKALDRRSILTSALVIGSTRTQRRRTGGVGS